MRNIDLRSSYEDIYENRFAAHGGKDTDAGAAYAKPSKGGNKKGVYTMKGKDGKPLFDKREEAEVDGEQLDEAIPAIAGAMAKSAAKAAAGAAATNMVDKAMKPKAKQTNEEVEELDEEGKKDACYHKVKSRYDVWPSAYASGALVKCRQKGAKNWGNSSKKEEVEFMDEEKTPGQKVRDKMSQDRVNKEVEEFRKREAAVKKRGAMYDFRRKPKSNKDMTKNESYTAAYMEGYKQLPAAKMQDKAAMKPDTARGEKQARKMDLVRKATKGNEDLVKQVTKGQEMANKKRGLERRFAMPSAKNAEQKKAKNAAYKLENQRRQDLNKRYGPKKEELEAVYAFLLGEGIAWNEESAINILNHMSDEWYESIVEGFLSESDYPLRDAMNAAGMNRAPKAAPIKPTPKKPVTTLPKKGMA